MRSLPLLAVVLILGALTGCGGSSSRPKGVNSDTAGRHYTAIQVERAFAAQGIVLRLAGEQFPGYVVLQAGRKPRNSVAVLVELSTGHARPTDYATGAHRIQSKGNVRVSFAPAETQPVQKALARLG
jgi:hypothetical protein